MKIASSEAYRRAFALYLRKGVPIELSLIELTRKARAVRGGGSHYIWRTRGDSKVRASHAANNGRIFSWDDPPPTGHPGGDYNCRCWAQPYTKIPGGYLVNPVISIADEGLYRWEGYDFVLHFYFGGGREMRLADIGHLQDVIDRANVHGLKPPQVIQGAEEQIAGEARAVLSGSIRGDFSRSYDFSAVSYVHGSSTVSGNFIGAVQRENEFLIISADVNYAFSDVFTDPLDIIETITATPKDLDAFIIRIAASLHLGVGQLKEIYKAEPKFNPDDIYDWIKVLSEIGGTKYPITGEWKTELHGYIYKDPARSQYPSSSRSQ